MTDSSLKLLAVDDDEVVLRALRMMIPGHWSLTSLRDPRAIPRAEKFAVALVDLHLTGDVQLSDGLEVIRSLHDRDPQLEIVAISGDLQRDLMEDCLEAGATRFLAKPLSPDEVLLTLDKIEALRVLQRPAAETPPIEQRWWAGSSASAQAIQRQIARLKGERGPILIEGESGTGKEIAAILLHGQESARPFVTVNVAAVPESLFESEFFGHVRGAFTGADQNKIGLTEAADGGDLFLDEVEALPLSHQAKLLRFLESGEVRRVGAKDTTRVHVRVIAASNRRLERLVLEGKFREDLLWRLSARKILLPPLRERLEDLPQLAEFFLRAERPRRNKAISPEALEALLEHSWPGNIRELKRVIEQVSLLSPLPVIRRQDVEQVLQPRPRFGVELDVDLRRGLSRLLQSYEREILRRALSENGEIEEVAKILQISRSNLYKKLRDHGIEMKS